jgi:hemoglobin
MGANTTSQTSRPNAQQDASLYDRLGGANGIAALVDDIVEAHMQNPAINARFLPLKDDPEHLKQVMQHLRSFLAAGSGGPGQYNGKSMRDAHRGMNISEAEYMAGLDDIMGVLQQHGIDEQTQKDVLSIGYALKGDILRV